MTSTTWKSVLRKRLARAPLRYLARPAFDAVVAAELSAVRCYEAAIGRAPSEIEGVTAIIKTFERPRLLRRLVAGLLQHFPGLTIIVADDSREPSRLEGVTTLPLPFDSGVSAGRQAALEAVKTPLTWVLDDDFIVYWGTRLPLVLAVLRRHRQLDLVGGPVIDLPLGTVRGSPRELTYPTTRSPLVAPGTRFGSVEVCDKVPNFFVARTERLKLVGWDPRLKRVEHGDFFTRARGVLVSGFERAFSCLHAQEPFAVDYMARRDDHEADERVLRERYFASASSEG